MEIPIPDKMVFISRRGPALGAGIFQENKFNTIYVNDLDALVPRVSTGMFPTSQWTILLSQNDGKYIIKPNTQQKYIKRRRHEMETFSELLALKWRIHVTEAFP